jgi:PAS domain-containing protein
MASKANNELPTGLHEVSRETLLRVLTDGPDGILVTDRAGRVRWANPALTGLLGLDPDDPPRLRKVTPTT